MENIVESEVDNIVQPEDCGGGQYRSVDNIDGEEEEGEAEEKIGHEVAQLVVKIEISGKKLGLLVKLATFCQNWKLWLE